VDGGTRAVIFDKVFGIQEKTVGEGTHFRIPFIQEPVIFDIRSRPRVIHSSTGTKDLQMVS
jgi:prohibitin 1